jgi:hypothetical protein
MQMSGRTGRWGTGLQAVVLTQRMQKLRLVLVLGQRLVSEQRKLHQKRVKLLVEEGRRQLLLGWRHQLSSGGR